MQAVGTSRGLRWLSVTLLLAVTVAIAFAAGLALAGSWWALGFETGWWQGDRNMNDGEGVPLLFVGGGLLSISVASWVAFGWLLLGSASRVVRRVVLVAGAVIVLAAASGSALYFTTS